jgi:large subunit ribosomal protein L4
VKRLALKCALSAKAKDDSIYLVESLTLETPKTKEMIKIMNDLGLGGKKCTLVLGNMDKNVSLSVRNIPHLRPRLAANLNAYDLIDSEAVVFTQDALTKLIENLREA